MLCIHCIGVHRVTGFVMVIVKNVIIVVFECVEMSILICKKQSMDSTPLRVTA